MVTTKPPGTGNGPEPTQAVIEKDGALTDALPVEQEQDPASSAGFFERFHGQSMRATGIGVTDLGMIVARIPMSLLLFRGGGKVTVHR